MHAIGGFRTTESLRCSKLRLCRTKEQRRFLTVRQRAYHPRRRTSATIPSLSRDEPVALVWTIPPLLPSPPRAPRGALVGPPPPLLTPPAVSATATASQGRGRDGPLAETPRVPSR